MIRGFPAPTTILGTHALGLADYLQSLAAKLQDPH